MIIKESLIRDVRENKGNLVEIGEFFAGLFEAVYGTGKLPARKVETIKETSKSFIKVNKIVLNEHFRELASIGKAKRRAKKVKIFVAKDSVKPLKALKGDLHLLGFKYYIVAEAENVETGGLKARAYVADGIAITNEEKKDVKIFTTNGFPVTPSEVTAEYPSLRYLEPLSGGNPTEIVLFREAFLFPFRKTSSLTNTWFTRHVVADIEDEGIIVHEPLNRRKQIVAFANEVAYRDGILYLTGKHEEKTLYFAVDTPLIARESRHWENRFGAELYDENVMVALKFVAEHLPVRVAVSSDKNALVHTVNKERSIRENNFLLTFENCPLAVELPKDHTSLLSKREPPRIIKGRITGGLLCFSRTFPPGTKYLSIVMFFPEPPYRIDKKTGDKILRRPIVYGAVLVNSKDVRPIPYVFKHRLRL